MSIRTRHQQYSHHHGFACGHVAIIHAGHTDYLHDGHLQYAHLEHVDERLMYTVPAVHMSAFPEDVKIITRGRGK
jgi:hypothetical protein